MTEASANLNDAPRILAYRAWARTRVSALDDGRRCSQLLAALVQARHPRLLGAAVPTEPRWSIMNDHLHASLTRDVNRSSAIVASKLDGHGSCVPPCASHRLRFARRCVRVDAATNHRAYFDNENVGNSFRNLKLASGTGRRLHCERLLINRSHHKREGKRMRAWLSIERQRAS